MLASPNWVKPSQELFLKLSHGEVHVWRALLEDSSSQAARYGHGLSADEQARAERFRSSQAQNQFVITRGILRNLLSQYGRVSPSTLEIENTVHGKPRLPDSLGLPLRFNVSHTRGMVLLAVTVDREVGIDVENIGRELSDHDIAARYFSPRESAYLASLPSNHRTQEFFTFWTCKEAFLKMQGMGLRGGLTLCEIALDPDGIRADIILENGLKHENDCSLFRVHAGRTHIGALAVACPSVNVSFWEWQH